jgi:hypothetical protein
MDAADLTRAVVVAQIWLSLAGACGSVGRSSRHWFQSRDLGQGVDKGLSAWWDSGTGGTSVLGGNRDGQDRRSQGLEGVDSFTR